MRFLVVFFALALVSASHGSKMSKNQHQHQHHGESELLNLVHRSVNRFKLYEQKFWIMFTH